MNSAHLSSTRLLTSAAVCALVLGLGGTAAAKTLTKSVTVKGHVTVRLAVISGDIEVKTVKGSTVSVKLTKTSAKSVDLVVNGNQISVTIQRGKSGHEGDVSLTVPAGADLNISSVSGDVQINGTIGDMRVRNTSGDIDVASGKDANIRTVSGDIDIGSVTGDLSVKTVSGDVDVRSSAARAPRIQFKSTSGDFKWSGLCAKGCSMSLEALSGELDVYLDSKSSFRLNFSSFSGGLDDQLGTKKTNSTNNRRGGGAVEARYGKGEGKIDASTFSGAMTLKKK